MAYPLPYAPRSAPIIPGGEAQYLQQELREIQDTLNGVLDMLPQEASAPPARPRPGMIRRAVAPWRPVGGTADVWVSWHPATASWALLNA
jgi:hypothetical protein